MNKLDELFREKLINHSIPPSPKAWEKVEASLSKKNRNVTWMRWAAVFLLGALLTGMVWFQLAKPAVEIAKEKNPEPRKDKAVQKETPPPVAPGQEKTIVKNAGKKKESKKVKATGDLQVTTNTVVEEKAAEVKLNTNEVELVKEETRMASQSTVEQPKAIVLTYTLDPVGNETPGEDTAEKENSFKRVVEFARNVKNSESPLGGLREMKGDLFALDLKKKANSKKH